MAKIKIEKGKEGKSVLIHEGEYEYVEGGVLPNGKITFCIVITGNGGCAVHLEFENEEEFKEKFINSLLEQIKESKLELKESS